MYKYGQAIINGVLDEIISGLMHAVTWIFQKLLFWILDFVYECVIYVPLVIINTIAIIFRFFAGGFMNYIFGDGSPIFDPSTGKINLNFTFDSQLGQIVFYTFVVSVVLFFFLYMLTFATGGLKDDDGNPAKGPFAHFKAMRWPAYMLMALFLLPYLFVFGDYLMQQVLMYFNDSVSTAFTSDDINNLRNNFLPLFYGFSNNFQMATININGSNFATITVLTNLQANLKTIQDYLANNPTDSWQFENQIDVLQNNITNILLYLNSTSSTDYATVSTIINGLQPNDYLSSDNAAAILTVKTHLSDFYNIFESSLGSSYSSLNDSFYNSQWDIILSGTDLSKATILAPVKALTDSWNDTTDLATLHTFGYDTINQLANGYNPDGSATRFLSLSSIYYKVPGYQNFPMVGIIYSAATGDPNPYNWTDPFGSGFAKKADVLRWVLTTFAVWGMVIIVYTYCYDTVKRIFYLIGYWIIGFLQLANGLNNSRSVDKWYKDMFNRWLGVIVVMVCFEIASILVAILQPYIVSGLSVYSQYNLSDTKILVNIGVILSLEAGYQVGFMVYDKFMNEKGSGRKSNSYSSGPQLVSSGSGLFSSALSTAEYYGTGGVVKDAYKKVNDEYIEYWKGKKDTKLARENAAWGQGIRIADAKTTQQKLNLFGYDLEKGVHIRRGAKRDADLHPSIRNIRHHVGDIPTRGAGAVNMRVLQAGVAEGLIPPPAHITPPAGGWVLPANNQAAAAPAPANAQQPVPAAPVPFVAPNNAPLIPNPINVNRRNSTGNININAPVNPAFAHPRPAGAAVPPPGGVVPPPIAPIRPLGQPQRARRNSFGSPNPNASVRAVAGNPMPPRVNRAAPAPGSPLSAPRRPRAGGGRRMSSSSDSGSGD